MYYGFRKHKFNLDILKIYIYSLATSPYLLGEVLFGQPFYEGFGRGACVEDAAWFYFILAVFSNKYYQCVCKMLGMFYSVPEL